VEVEVHEVHVVNEDLEVVDLEDGNELRLGASTDLLLLFLDGEVEKGVGELH
jgi:hypothetical protein